MKRSDMMCVCVGGEGGRFHTTATSDLDGGASLE